MRYTQSLSATTALSAPSCRETVTFWRFRVSVHEPGQARTGRVWRLPIVVIRNMDIKRQFGSLFDEGIAEEANNILQTLTVDFDRLKEYLQN